MEPETSFSILMSGLHESGETCGEQGLIWVNDYIPHNKTGAVFSSPLTPPPPPPEARHFHSLWMTPMLAIALGASTIVWNAEACQHTLPLKARPCLLPADKVNNK